MTHDELAAAVPADLMAMMDTPVPEWVTSGPPRHNFLFYMRVRGSLHRRLSRRLGADKADEALAAWGKKEIDGVAFQAGLRGKLGDGKILQWIIDHKDQIIAVIKIIFTIVMMFLQLPPALDEEDWTTV